MSSLRRIRQQIQMSQKEMARLLGVSQANISHYELGRQGLPSRIARKIIVLAQERGRSVNFDDIYGDSVIRDVSREIA